MSKKEEELIAHCGLFCGDCFGNKQIIADMARDLRKELRQAKFKKFADGVSEIFPVFEKYDDAYEVLGAMVKFRCKKACRNGGGPPFCKMRKCCQHKDIEGCWECDDFETCEKLNFLNAVHDDGHIKNLRRLKKKGKTEFVKGKRDW